jgi:TolB-like protein/predicted Ser/Thr protein kinase
MSAPDPLIGRTISHYRIIEKLGGGGMGEVYRARDSRLDRDVALKVLPAGTLADETARRRFRREALTLSQLNHPGIAVVHDFDSENGVDFLVMEYVAGETLASKLAAGPLPEKDVIDLGTQVAEALEEANERDIIHRDLKPDNVMVTPKGRVKVLDFGLAKLMKPNEANATTVSVAESLPGAVVGTVPYMAPEQLQGQPVDGRADVYALGAVMYEAATGRRPFPERQTSQLIAAILTRVPQPPHELNGQVSAGLEAIVLKALEKDPGQRYQSAKELLGDLGRVGVPGAAVGVPRRSTNRWILASVGAALVVVSALLVALNTGGIRDRFLGAGGTLRIQSLAVLPLENLSGDPQQDYFADGMTDELITDLAKISALKVISRTSMMRYRNTKESLPQIAKELNVDAVVEGSVLREGGRVRVTAELINAKTDRDLWANSYERNLRSVLALQSEIASAVVGKVRAALTPEEKSRLASARTVNPQAYDAYLKGMQYWYKATPQGQDTALEYFELALKNDPNSARAYVGIAELWAGRAQMGSASPAEAWPKFKAALQKAIELDDTLPEAHLALAVAKYNRDWDWAGSGAEFKKVFELNPNYADAHAYYADMLAITGRLQEAQAEMERALDLDPLNGLDRSLYGSLMIWNHRYDDAIAQAQLSLKTTPGNPIAYSALWQAYSRKGAYKEALDAAIMEARSGAYRKSGVDRILEQGYAEGGYKVAMRSAAEALVAYSHKSHVAPDEIVDFYIEAGDHQKALDWLEKAFQAHEPGMNNIGHAALYDSLRAEPRFQALVRKLHLPQ